MMASAIAHFPMEVRYSEIERFNIPWEPAHDHSGELWITEQSQHV